MKKIFKPLVLVLLPLSIASGFPRSAYAVETVSTGYVTPTEVTITFTSLSLYTTDNKQRTLLSGTFPSVFRRTDSNFATVSLAGVTVPAGRYIGVSICYNTDRSVKLDGVVYQGTGVLNGSTIYSKGTTALAANSIVAAIAPVGGATTMPGDIVGNGTNNCSNSYFNAPVCVGAADKCTTSGDTVVDPASTTPNLNILLDMYHSVGIDAGNMSVDNHVAVYPYPTIGRAGAAFHLTANSGTTFGDMTLLFDASKRLMYTSTSSNNSIAGLCNGVGAITVTGAPATGFLNAYGPSWVQTADTTTGKVQWAAGNSGTGNVSVSSGINVLNNFKQAVGATTTSTCVADSAATPPYLGFTYTAGAGGNGTNVTWTVTRIIDPTNLFGVCTTATGSCSTVTSPSDGYP